MSGLTLSLDAPSTAPLDQALVVVVALRNVGTAPVTTSSRLNLVEGDLSVLVRPPGGGSAVRASWPWPVDSALREATLEPGQELVGSALVVAATGGKAPFPVAGTYSLVAEFTPHPGDVVRSRSVDVQRSAPTDDAGRARQRALEDPEVTQSICSLSLIGSAADGLALLAAADESPVAQLLATAVTTVTAELPPAVDRAYRLSDPATVGATLAAVLPPGVFPGDERLDVARETLRASDDSRVDALLTGQPIGDG
jgi:hypothetical protein